MLNRFFTIWQQSARFENENTMSKRNMIIAKYLQQIINEYSQKIFETQASSLSHFYAAIAGMIFEKEGFLAQAFLCYQSSTHPFAIYSRGYFYEQGMGGATKKIEKAKQYYAQIENHIEEAKQATLSNDNHSDENDGAKTSPYEGLVPPTTERAKEIDLTVQHLIRSHSQKIQNEHFFQLLVGLVYENLGYPVQALLIYKKVKHFADSLYSLGYLHEVGMGVSHNIEKAKKFYLKAKELNLSKAVVALERLDSLMAPKAIALDERPAVEIAETVLPAAIVNNAQSRATEQEKVSNLNESTGPQTTTNDTEKAVVINESIAPLPKENPQRTLLFSSSSSSITPDEKALRDFGNTFHRLRLNPGVTKAELLPSYLGMMRIFEARVKMLDEKNDTHKKNIVFNCIEIIKLDRKFPMSQFPGILSAENALQLQHCQFTAHLYISKHEQNISRRKAHQSQAVIEAKHYCELASDSSTAETLRVKNYYSQQVFQQSLKAFARNSHFSQDTVCFIIMSLARIHRNGGNELFFKIFNSQKRFCPIQSIKLALNLMQSALTIANNPKLRKLVVAEIEFMNKNFPNEIKTIQENDPDIVDTSRKPIHISPEQCEEKLFALIDNYSITIEELFAKNDGHTVIPRIMRQIAEYFKRENHLAKSLSIMTDAAADIEAVTKVRPSAEATNTRASCFRAH